MYPWAYAALSWGLWLGEWGADWIVTSICFLGRLPLSSVQPSQQQLLSHCLPVLHPLPGCPLPACCAWQLGQGGQWALLPWAGCSLHATVPAAQVGRVDGRERSRSWRSLSAPIISRTPLLRVALWCGLRGGSALCQGLLRTGLQLPFLAWPCTAQCWPGPLLRGCHLSRRSEDPGFQGVRELLWAKTSPLSCFYLFIYSVCGFWVSACFFVSPRECCPAVWGTW